MTLRDRLNRLFRTTEEIASDDLHRLAADAGADTIGQAPDRARVTLRGTIGDLTIRPRRTVPWLEATLSDGTGSVSLIWMGRREIPGIEAGRNLIVEGRISVVDGQRRIYNPRYQLL